MQPNNRNELWEVLKSEAVSGMLLAVIVLSVLCLASWASGGQPCRQVVRKNVKAQTVLVPYNYGHRNALIEIPVDAVYSEIAYPIGVPIGTYAPVTYTPAPPGDGLQQPRLIERVIERYADEPLVEEVTAEEVVAETVEPACRPSGACETEGSGAVDVHSLPGLTVAKENCASCHTGKKAKAANRPVFFNDAGEFIATPEQQQKLLTSARLGTMPPPKSGEPLTDDEYLALSSWLSKTKGEVQAPTKKRKVVGIGFDGTSLITQE